MWATISDTLLAEWRAVGCAVDIKGKTVPDTPHDAGLVQDGYYEGNLL